MKLTRLSALFCAAALSACSSTSEPMRHYQLPDSAFRLPENAALHGEIAVQIVLAEPLNGSGLLYQSDELNVNVAQKNLWAAPLADALAANLANKLNERTAHSAFVPQKLAKNPKGSLKIYFDRFQGTHRGETEISGYGQWHDGRSRHFTVRTAQVGDGYAPMVESLNKGLHTVAVELVR